MLSCGKIEDYSVSIGKICLISAIKNILNYYGNNLTESELFCLCEGHLFYFGGLNNYSEIKLERKNLLRELKMGSMKYDFEEILLTLKRVLNINVESHPFTDSKNVKQLIEYYIQKNIPVLSLVLRKYLSYTPQHLADYISHVITVVGYDWKREIVEIADNYIPTIPISRYIGPLDLKDYFLALDLEKSVFEVKSTSRLIAIIPAEHFKYQIDIEHKKDSLIRIAKRNMEGGVVEKDIETGIGGIRKLRDEISIWNQIYSKEMRKKIYITLHNLITNYAGPVISFEFLEKNCLDIFKRTCEIRYLHSSSLASDIKKKWMIVGNLCAKAAYLQSDKSLYNNIIFRIDEIAKVEETFYQQIMLYKM